MTIDLKYHTCLNCPLKVNVNILITKKVTYLGREKKLWKKLRILMFGNFPI